MKSPPFFIISMLVLMACAPEPTATTTPTSLPTGVSSLQLNPDKAEIVRLSGMFRSADFIRLATSENHLIDEVRKLQVRGDKLYFMCNSAIFAFDTTGAFVFQINRKGKGPGEYVSLTDMHLSSAGDTIEVLDNVSRSVLTYDQQGRYLQQWNIPFVAQSFSKLSEDLYVFYCGNMLMEENSYKLVFYSKRQHTPLKQFFTVNANEARYLHARDLVNFSAYGSRLTFLHSFNDTIYSLQPSGVQYRFVCEFGPYQTPADFYATAYQDVAEFMQTAEQSAYAYRLAGFFETDHLILFAFRQKGHWYHVFYPKNKGIPTVAHQIMDDLAFHGLIYDTSFDNLPKAAAGNTMYRLMEPSVFIEQLEAVKSSLSKNEWETYTRTQPHLMEIYHSLKLNDNPLVYLLRE
ncbi:MAG: 6-bladed beta-propeller [Bacteroidetes bacterium]|nr:MAG: 6-bladed beta-propeller [Bacteroidota bacterium]